MTFTPALAAKIAETSAVRLQEQIDLTINFGDKGTDRLIAAGHVRRAMQIREARDAARSGVRTAIESAKALSGWIDRSTVHQTTHEQYAALGGMDPDYYTVVAFAAQDSAVLALWSRYKTVYAIDGDLLAELGDTDDDTLVPAGLWQRLGHSDPYVALPSPLVLPMSEGNQQWIDGFWITGRHQISEDGYVTVSTHAPGNREIGLLTHARIMQPDGRPLLTPLGNTDANWTRLTLADGQTVGEMVTAAMGRFTDASEGINWRADVPVMLRRIVSILVYLCASNADMEALPNPPRARKTKGGKARPNAPRVIATGFRVGSAIRAYRSTRAGAERGEPTGRTVAPHIRRAHFQSFRVGPGRPNERTQVEIKWVAPIPVKMGDGRAAKPTIHEVKETGRDRVRS